MDIDEEDEAQEAEVRMVSEAHDFTYSDEDTDWAIFKIEEEENEARFKSYMDLVGEGSRLSERCFVRGVAEAELS